MASTNEPQVSRATSESISEPSSLENPTRSESATKSEKQRRQQRSCDLCRQRKSDGSNLHEGSCSNCLAFGSPCTYEQPHKKRGPKYTKNATTEDLKREIASLKAQLQSLSISVCSICARSLPSQPQENESSRSTSVGAGSTSSGPKEPPDEQELTADELATRFSQFSLSTFQTTYFGSASNFALASNASVMKEKYFGPSSLGTHSRRPYFWQVLPWEKEVLFQQPVYIYPADDLVASLLEIFFANVHPTFPLLHRPLFERFVAEGLHHTDVRFGGTLLAVLAVASRFSQDPRVFVDPGAPLSAGWKFANQLWGVRRFFETTLHEVQMYSLLTLFVLGTSMPHASWFYCGLGIRSIQQRGEHRQKPEGHKWSLEDELWKRAFWFLVTMERVVCLFLGRPIGIHLEEYDLDLPLAVDDEYLSQGLMQPPGVPSRLSYFVCYIQLCEILGDATKRLYGSKKAKKAMGWDGPEWEQRAVAELDSAMNRFLDSIPPHLRWDPENVSHGPFFDQTATLHITYNYVLIAIHRRYIQRASADAAPSLSICARAARAILHTADIWLRTLQRLPLTTIYNPVFVSGVVLVLYMLGTKRAGLPMDKNKDLMRVATALGILKLAESRFQPPGRLWEILRELWSLDGSFPLTDIDPLRNESGSVDATGAASRNIPTASYSPPNALGEYYQPLFEQSFDSWNTNIPTGDESIHKGQTIEELLASNVPVDSILDDELMSMWMAAPDMLNVQQWDTYMETRNANAADATWFRGFGDTYA
ncbi:fungal-specific transcription factor domain-containing protein [Mycena galopus ATCC 62051]|nr:fungal-specific transcription factor domain-containing protein [Mycena galopus ATCC 62051]